MCSNPLVRSLCGALVLVLLVGLTGHAQALNPPTGEGRITGRILTSMSEPIPDATVLLGLNDTGAPFESSASWVATSDQDGLYEFAGLPAGRFILLAAKDGYAGWQSIPAASVAGRVVDALGQVPRTLQLEYGVPGATHRGLLSVSSPDGWFHIRDRGIVPGPLTIIGRGESDEGPLIGFLTLTTIDGPNDVEIIVGKPGGVRGRVSMEGEVPLGAVGARLALVREGFTPLGASEAVRRRGLRVANDRLVIRNAEILDELEIVIGPR